MGCKVRQEPISVLSAYALDSEKQAAAEFLISNLPPSDHLSMSNQDFYENIDYAFKTREEVSWGKTIPSDIFLHHVLPHRLINEPFKPYRKQFHDLLMPLVKNSQSALEAAIRINLWCASQVEYRPSSFWLSTPIDILKVGFGRCEELSILFTAAARSVGIPVRGCWVPAWRHTNDNHVWVEIWNAGQWIPLDAGALITNPNNNWFLGPAQSAPAVYSPIYGHPVNSIEPVYRQGKGYTTLNLTQRYATTDTFELFCTHHDGTPAIDQQILLWTYNYGVPCLAGRGRTNTNGICKILLGKGSYIASAGNGTTVSVKISTPGKTTKLHLGEPLLDTWEGTLTYPQTRIALHHYPSLEEKTEEALKGIAAQAITQQKNNKSLAIDKAKRILAALPEVLPAITEALLAPWPSAPRLSYEYRALSPEGRRLIAPLLTQMDPKDLALTNLSALTEHTRNLQSRLKGKPFIKNERRSNADLLSPRIYGEPFSLWEMDTSEICSQANKQDIDKTVEAAMDYAVPHQAVQSTPFSAKLTPKQTLTDKTAATLTDQLTLTIAILRTLGIASAYQPHITALRYKNGNKWQITPRPNYAFECITIPATNKTVNGHNESIVALDGNGFFTPIHFSQKAAPKCVSAVKLFRLSGTRGQGEVFIRTKPYNQTPLP